jgi:hypothetical protein
MYGRRLTEAFRDLCTSGWCETGRSDFLRHPVSGEQISSPIDGYTARPRLKAPNPARQAGRSVNRPER